MWFSERIEVEVKEESSRRRVEAGVTRSSGRCVAVVKVVRDEVGVERDPVEGEVANFWLCERMKSGSCAH